MGMLELLHPARFPSENQPYSPGGGFQSLPEESESNGVRDTLGMKCCFIAPKWSLVGGAILPKMGTVV